MAKGSVKIDSESCKGCELCVGVCPVGIITMEKKTFNSSGYLPAGIMDMDKCIACGNCAVICPDSAISVYRIDIQEDQE